MHKLTSRDREGVKALLDGYQAGYSLAGEFYNDEGVYQADIEQVWRNSWLFVGYSCEIPKAGNYFTFKVGDDSLIVIRGDEGEINVFYNTCRHRGTLLCAESKGTTRKLVCPYHQWIDRKTKIFC